MATAVTHRVDWSLLWQQRGFRYFFMAMFISLFGSGMNFIGVSWYIMSATHSTVVTLGAGPATGDACACALAGAISAAHADTTYAVVRRLRPTKPS